jgi:hypothetical protein
MTFINGRHIKIEHESWLMVWRISRTCSPAKAFDTPGITKKRKSKYDLAQA